MTYQCASRFGAAALLAAALAGPAQAQSTATDEIAKYREMLQDGNPADLWEIRGEELWKQARGPRKASFERCDLGQGPGVVQGAYARLPRYFADTDKVQDLESRLLSCMVDLQGLSDAEARKNLFSKEGSPSDMEALVAYVAAASKGMRVEVPTEHPKEQEAYRIGEQAFYYRAGPHDFSCATCHAESGKRIRLQDLPKLTGGPGAQQAFGAWPAYRVSQGTVRTMQHRLYDCFRQQRFPAAEYGSELLTALTVYMGKNADGGEMAAPALKR